MTSERGENELNLLEDLEEVSVINVEAFIDEQVVVQSNPCLQDCVNPQDYLVLS